MAGAVYWVGADGNLYVKGAASVNGGATTNVGSAPKTMGIDNNANNGYGITSNQINLPGLNIAAQQIADPATATTPTAPAVAGKNTAMDDAAIANTQGSINQIAPLLASALASEGTSYGNATGALDASQKQQQGQYDSSTTTNQQNYDSNFMDSVRSGIKGLGSLMNILRGSGASGGTAEDQVRDVVGGQTADDIRTGADTQKGNQTTLDNALSSFLTDLKSKKAAADDTHANNVHAINAQSATNLQDLYSKMAGYYGDKGDTGAANTAMAQAGALTPQIAANSSTQTSAYDTTPVPVQAPQLTAFAPPTAPNAISAPNNGQVGSGIFTISKAKKDDSTAAPTAAAAPAAGV